MNTRVDTGNGLVHIHLQQFWITRDLRNPKAKELFDNVGRMLSKTAVIQVSLYSLYCLEISSKSGVQI